MAKGYEDDIWEDDACLECGATHYHESKTPGICVECYNDLKEEGHRLDNRDGDPLGQ